MNEPKPFITDRTRFWRSQKLDAGDTRTIDCVEAFGCQVLHVGKDENDGSAGFSYTCGLFDTTGKPELIVIGLNEETAHYLLNEAAKRQRDGMDLTDGLQEEMIASVPCVFRPVDAKWKEHLMRYDGWYYNHYEFPALQAIYPDLDGRFQFDEAVEGEEPFREYFRQALLQPGTLMTVKEDDLWNENDPKSSLFDWKFPDPPHTMVYLSQAVQTGREPVTYACHELVGDWQFHGDSMSEDLPPAVSCFHHLIDNDPSLIELADLPMGWWAERAAVGEPWIRRELTPDSE